MKREPRLTEIPNSSEYEDDLSKETAQNVSSYLEDKEYFKKSRAASRGSSSGSNSVSRQTRKGSASDYRSTAERGSRVRTVSPDSEYESSSSASGRKSASYAQEADRNGNNYTHGSTGSSGGSRDNYSRGSSGNSDRNRDDYRRGSSGGSRDNYSRGSSGNSDRNRDDYRRGSSDRRGDDYNQGQPGGYDKKKKRKKRSVGRFIGKLAGICVALILILVILVIIPATRYWAAGIILRTPIGTAAASAYLGTEYNTNVRDSDFDSSLIEKNSGISAYGLYYTFALLGVDARDEELEDGSRTDTMIVVSVNRITGSIKMASIARDTYLYMSCDGTTKYAKANAAYAYWGAEGTISMLNQNFDLNIQDYVVVNFAGLTTIVDLIGGITIEVTEAELEYVNKYVKEQSSIDGVDYELLTETGTVTLTGAQATAYCRIRYTNFISPEDGTVYSSDWGRTARQRYVLTALLSQMRNTSAAKLASAAKTVCAENTGDDRFIISSLSIGQLTSLLGMCITGDIDETSSFPVSGEYYSASLSVGDSVIPDTLEENAVLLHEFLYGDTNYTVSSDLSSAASAARSTLN